MHRKFLRDSLICLIPCLLAAIIVFRAWQKYEDGTGGFKLGLDLVGGTSLIYEVDQERERQRRALEKNTGGGDFSGAKTSQALAEAIKRRIDSADVQNILVRPIGDNRIEIVIPTVRTGGTKKSAELESIKSKIEDVGSLEFRIVANSNDDQEAFTAAKELFANTKPEELDLLAINGELPPTPTAPEGNPWMIVHDGKPMKAEYAWVELGPITRQDFGGQSIQTNRPKRDANGNIQKDANGKVITEVTPEAEQSELWKKLAAARDHGVPAGERKPNQVVELNTGSGIVLLCSRKCQNSTLPEEDIENRKYEYYVLTRVSERVVVDGSRVTVTATAGMDPVKLRPSIEFQFNNAGGQDFYKMTSDNKPEQNDRFTRQLGIVINGLLVSYANIQAVIGERGQITGNFDQEYVNLIVSQLRSGALPATLKKKPVSENTIGPTLGAETIKSGTRAVGFAYVAVLIFMLIYYRFAGVVACTALLANLLLTIGFMVSVNATFTLPGLAGLVLMLGMAVDANILIYERVREERDRGASLQMAIRNGYDRAFGTIIDTHLSSIFTAIVLYAVGNDQLRGFGISLAAGLIISLFTSLFMTHLLFDYWLHRNWLKNLKMMRFLTKPQIDFMKLRKIMFPITGIVTIIGLGIFLIRGEKSLNVDFVGGVVYGGLLKDDMDISTLRSHISDSRQASVLAIDSVEKISNQGSTDGREFYKLKYKDGEERDVELALGLEGNTPEEKLANLKARASVLPDWAIEQNFLSSSSGDKSRYFTIRTTEKEPDLVQASIDRLFTEDKKSKLAKIQMSYVPDPAVPFSWIVSFTDPEKKVDNAQYASEAYIKPMLERAFRDNLPKEVKDDKSFRIVEAFRLQGIDKPVDGRYSQMRVTLSREAQQKSLENNYGAKVLDAAQLHYNLRPQPERLETFDPTLAGEMRNRAMVAIVASWIALLLYLWFRFGNWTFGLAAVLCLIHDLCFTIGAIAFSHYLHDTWIGNLLGLRDFKIDFAAVAALLTLVGYSVNEIIVNFARLREVRGKNPLLTPQMINDSVNQTLSRTILTSTTVWLVVMVLYAFGGDGVHLFAFVMVVGVLVGTYSSIYVACPLLLAFGEGHAEKRIAPASQTPQEATV